MDDHIRAADISALVGYRRLGPYAAKQHPTEEHLLQLYTSLGAAGPNLSATRLHHSVEFGFLSTESYAFQ
jgi:4,5-DOPA dioxygenase extradiol